MNANIVKYRQMTLPRNIQNDYSIIKHHGSLSELMEITGVKSHSHMSKIMNGKTGTTFCRITKIQKFIEKRKKQIEKLNTK